MKNQKQILCVLASMITLQAGMPVFAQQAVDNSNILIGAGAGTGGRTFVGNAGDYNFNQISQDNTALALKALEQAKVANEIDRQYLMSIVERLNNHVLSLIQLELKLTELSQNSQTRDFVKLTDYLNVVNQINQKDQILKAEIQTQTLITRESLPSYEPMKVGNTTLAVNTSGNVSMKAVMDRMEQLRGSIISKMNALQFPRLITELGQPTSVTTNALTPILTGLAIMTSEQIATLENEIKLKLTLAADTRALQNDYVNVSVTNIYNFVKNYGTSEWLRFTGDNDSQARAEAFKNIQASFLRRSYLRKKYGIRMGAIQTKGYPKQIINVEKFGIQPLREALNSFRREAALEEADVISAFESARNFVQLYDEKVTPVFKSGKEILANKNDKVGYSSTDTGFIVRANSTLTYVTGQRLTAEVLLMVMRLALADAREEMMLLQNDKGTLIAYHDARYRSTNELKSSNNQWICENDYSLSQETHNKVCAPIGVKAKAKRSENVTGKSLKEIFSNLLAQYENVEKSKRQEADMKQQLIEAARAALRTDADKAAEEDLFN